MRCKTGLFGSAFGGWRDRVDDPVDGAFSDLPDGIEEIATDAIAFAQTVIESAIEPLIDALAGLPGDFADGRWRWRRPRGDTAAYD